MNLSLISPSSIKTAIKTLKQGGIVAYPADTCFGLAADMTNPEAVKKLITLKGRDGLKPMSVMFASSEDLNGYVELNSMNNPEATLGARKIIQELLPGPYTLVLKKGPKVPSFYFPETDTLGIRIPNHALSLELIAGVGNPLITTSANLSGQPLTFTSDEVVNAFRENDLKPDFIFEGTVQNQGGASTVLQIQDQKIILLREGQIKKEEVERRLGISLGFLG